MGSLRAAGGYGFDRAAESVPPPWWDEGWTLSVARNWAESGHYGRLSLGQPVPAGIIEAVHITGGVGLSFWLFGVGIVQARLVEVVITVATLVLMYHLVRRIYNRSIALGSLFVMTLLSAYIDLFPTLHRQTSFGRNACNVFPVCGLHSYVISAAAPSVGAVLGRPILGISADHEITSSSVLDVLTDGSFVGSLIPTRLEILFILGGCTFQLVAGSGVLLALSEHLLQAKSGMAEPIRGLYDVTALVRRYPSRLVALIVVGMFGVPTLLGLCYGLLNVTKSKAQWTSTDQVSVALLFLASSWFGWFLLLSVGGWMLFHQFSSAAFL